MARATLSQLEAFFWIARLGSFKAAAERLGLAQPSVSFRIRELEAAFGVTFFERKGRRTVMSEHGELLLRYSERLLSLVDDMEASLAPAGSLRGVVRLGMPDSMALAYLGAIMKILDTTHRGLRLEISIDSSAGLVRLLRDRRLDLAIVGEPPPIPRYRVELIGRNPLAWVASPRLRLPERKLRPHDLADFNLLTAPEFSSTYNIMIAWFSATDIKPARINTCNSLSTIARLTIDAIGISILPISMLKGELDAGALKILDYSPDLPDRTVYSVYPENPVGASRRAVMAVLGAIRRSVARSDALTNAELEST